MSPAVSRFTSPLRTLLLILIAACLLALPASAAAGTIVADSGFRPDPNGFPTTATKRAAPISTPVRCSGCSAPAPASPARAGAAC